MRRYCSRRDAEGNAHNLADDIRMSSLEALLQDVLREKIKTYCECRGHAARNVRQKGPSHPGGDDPMDFGTFDKGKARTERAKAKESRTGTRARTRTRTRLNVGIVEDVDSTRKIVGSRRTPKVVRRENTDPGVQMHTILTRNHQLLNQKLKLTNST